MKKEEINSIVSAQRSFFRTGATLPVSFRIDALKRLREALCRNEDKIARAIEYDLGKNAFESYMCETGLVISEIGHMLRHIKSYAREKTVPTPLAHFPSRSFVKPVPHGTVLIMSPWNYPLLLTFSPLVDAISAGNTAVVKPSAYSPETCRVIGEIISEIFPPEYVAFIPGGREENTYLLDERFDYIFFTGSKAVGELVLTKAARLLTPVTLELGGKSPCIVDESANIPLTAKRLVWGKFLNGGQTCVAPDYVLCHKSVSRALTDALCAEIKRQYPSLSDCGKIINKKHFDRIVSLIDTGKTVCGGKSDVNLLKIEPTVMTGVSLADAVMQEEIFGPVLPILEYSSLVEAFDIIESFDRPLALYVFSKNKKIQREILSRIPFGGGCINDTVIHLATSAMGFGGVGESGMGAYHGKCGFDTFSHHKSIVNKKTWLDLPMRYRPFKRFYGSLIRLFLR
ncbi:MAG: aldehyde dehydrogenase [Oscillospiraceae bacterium]|nr:aldehyde dehydrogenase [Oscillospiraceae bacterium]